GGGGKVRGGGKSAPSPSPTPSPGPSSSSTTSPTVTVAPTTPPLTAPSPATRMDHVLVILATWTEPDSVTPDAARQQFFADDNAWFNQVSYGAYGITGDVTPWETIAGPDNGLCLANSTQILTQAESTAL